MKAFLAAALLLAAALAGCSSDKGGDDHKGDASTPPVLFLNVTAGNQTYRATGGGPAASSPTATVGATASGSASKSGTGSGAGAAANATVPKGNATQETPSGQVPLNVTVTVGASGLPAGKAFTWAVDFGDGSTASKANTTGSTGSASASASATNGTHSGHATGSAAGAAANATLGPNAGSRLPATLTHTYTEAGNHTIRFTLTVTGAAAVEAHAPVHAAAKPAGNQTGNTTAVPPPEATHFEFGQSLGCTGDLPVGSTCQDYAAGPPGSDTDGHWIPLNASYWGWTLSSTVDQGQSAANDSDCVFVDAALAELGNANNGSESCLGEAPAGAAWVFIYPYAAPAFSLVVDFAPTPPK